jgi:N-acyl-D-aspartate/D-glutamate deacylase
MRTFVSQALEAGAFGLSSGLGYEPGLWCQPGELENLASVLPRYPHAAYYTHIRNYRSGVLEAISEAVQVGKKTGVPVVIQHLLFKLPSNWDQTERGLNLLEESRAQGLKLYATVYPYDFWGNEVQIPLFQFLYLRPEMTRWSYYRDTSKYDEVLALIHRRLQEYGGGEKVEITKARSRDSRDSLGHTLGDLAKRRKMSEDEVVVSLLLENGEDLKICYHGLSEEGLIKKIQSPFVLFGSDSTGNISHPRDVGSFPRLLGNYVRDKKVIRLSEAVARLTREPAALLGLKDRGEIKEGNWGDVVVFDAKTIRDTATAVSPWSPPDGIRMVLVNGQVVFENASFTGRFPGQVLRRNDD